MSFTQFFRDRKLRNVVEVPLWYLNTGTQIPVFRIRIRIHKFLGLPDPVLLDTVTIWIRIRILLSSFYHQAKLVRKTFIPSFLWLFLDFLSLKNDVNIPSKSNKQNNFFLNKFFVGALKFNDENSSLVRGIDPQIGIRIPTKMSWIRNTDT